MRIDEIGSISLLTARRSRCVQELGSNGRGSRLSEVSTDHSGRLLVRQVFWPKVGSTMNRIVSDCVSSELEKPLEPVDGRR